MCCLSHPQRFKEGASINKSLLTLSLVIKRLVQAAQQGARWRTTDGVFMRPLK
jgi:hypothetical protein